jgi:hypothetical protein
LVIAQHRRHIGFDHQYGAGILEAGHKSAVLRRHIVRQRGKPRRWCACRRLSAHP